MWQCLELCIYENINYNIILKNILKGWQVDGGITLSSKILIIDIINIRTNIITHCIL